MQAMLGWMTAEGGHWNNSAHYNPLNTTRVIGRGERAMNGDGVKVYRSWEDGIRATVETLRLPAYRGIVSALRAGKPLRAAQAIEGSPWGTGGLAKQTIPSAPRGLGRTAPASGGSGSGSGSGSGGARGGSRVVSATVQVPEVPTAALVGALATRGVQSAPMVEASPLQLPSFAAGPRMAGGGGPALSGGFSPPAQSGGGDLVAALTDALPQDAPGGVVVSSEAAAGGGPRRSGGPGGSGGARSGRDRTNPRNLSGTATFEGHRVAAWIKPALVYGRKHGWTGGVHSGFRSFADQKRIYDSGVRPAARPGTSNHEGSDFPRGAVDVSNAPQLARILARSPYGRFLKYAGAKDPVHFSHPHGGSY